MRMEKAKVARGAAARAKVKAKRAEAKAGADITNGEPT